MFIKGKEYRVRPLEEFIHLDNIHPDMYAYCDRILRPKETAIDMYLDSWQWEAHMVIEVPTKKIKLIQALKSIR